jgi:integrase
MAKTVRDSNLQTRAARARLRPQRRPYWCTLRPGQLHLGYAKRHHGKPGYWTVRSYKGKAARGSPYVISRLSGTADDYEDANGGSVLSYAQAQDIALAPSQPVQRGPLTVANAGELYVASLRDNGREAAAIDAELRLRPHVLPYLGRERVASLTPEQLRGWLAGLARRLQDGADEEAVRRSRATANRIRTTFFAALNHCFAEGKVDSDAAWRRRVPPFKNVDISRNRYLTVEEARRLTNATEGSFRLVVQAGLQTGCRYGELRRLRVHDFHPDGGTVYIAKSKSSKARHVHLTAEGEMFFRELTVGRRGDELMFQREPGIPWQHADQHRRMQLAVARAGITPPISFHGLRHTYASLSAMANVPLLVLAENLGHTDLRMVTKHYAHLSQSHKRDAIRNGAPRFGLVRKGNVRPLHKS